MSRTCTEIIDSSRRAIPASAPGRDKRTRAVLQVVRRERQARGAPVRAARGDRGRPSPAGLRARDEVESLAHARRAALSGLEPSDSIRAVNALLTQLDRLRRRPNALVLTTSNVTGAIDVAFVDRADIKRRVARPRRAPPTRSAARLLRRAHGARAGGAAGGAAARDAARRAGRARAVGGGGGAAARAVSGRALRRLPFLARALHVRGDTTLPHFVAALDAALRDHLADAAALRELVAAFGLTGYLAILHSIDDSKML
uniref:Uncharacterized protein n=1 Tax=Heliothis virescens TaxID=7102 RepID=A0A2A4JKX0_HELVI